MLGLPGFPKGLISIVRGHQDRELAQEAAWLLAFITAGPEAHMHAMVKQGAARAVANALSCCSPRIQDGQVPALITARDVKNHLKGCEPSSHSHF